MYRYDYIVVLINEVSEIIARVVLNKMLKKYDECHVEVGRAMDLFGLNYHMLRILPAEQLVRFMSNAEGMQAEHYLKVATLIAHDAEAYAAEGDKESAEAFFNKSLGILDIAIQDVGEYGHSALRSEYQRIQNLMESLE